jgi:transposase
MAGLDPAIHDFVRRYRKKWVPGVEMLWGWAAAILDILLVDQDSDRSPSMSVSFDPRKSATAFDYTSTLVSVLELSGKSWELGASVPGVSRRPRRKTAVGEIAGVMKLIEQWKSEAHKAGHGVSRVVLGYEAGRDGFWIARALRDRGIEVYVMHPSSIAVERRGRRAKTDRIDVDMLLGALLGWLRGEPRRCTMAPVPSEAEEDMREPGREREALVAMRLKVENQIGSLLARFGIVDFKPRLKKAAVALDELRTFEGRPLPLKAMEKLRRLMVHHRLLSDQMKAIEEARQQVVAVPDPDRIERMIQMLVRIVGVGVETATVLVHEVFSRQFRDRRALAAFVGLTGTPFNSGGSVREQGISKNGNPRVRRIMTQLMWRWLKFQSGSALAHWFDERTGGAKGRIRKVMAIGLARKILVALWRYAEAGVVPEGVRLAAA